MVDQIEINGSVTFLGAEAVIDTPCGQSVFIALVNDHQANGAVTASQNVYTNTTGSIYGNITPTRNPNGTNRYTVLRTVTIEKPYVPLTQQAANDYSWPSKNIPFHFFVKLPKPIKVKFGAGTAGTIADVIDNSWSILAVTGGDTIGPLTSRMDAVISYNSRIRFYG